MPVASSSGWPTDLPRSRPRSIVSAVLANEHGLAGQPRESYFLRKVSKNHDLSTVKQLEVEDRSKLRSDVVRRSAGNSAQQRETPKIKNGVVRRASAVEPLLVSKCD